MRSMTRWSTAVGLAAVLVVVGLPQLSSHVVWAQSRKPYSIRLLYTGRDGLAYVKNMEIPAGPNGVVDLPPVRAVEVHRTRPGFAIGWHVEKRRQYLITLSGRGEIDIAGGKKIILTPGSILLVENSTGKGHMTRVLGNQAWVALWLPLENQPHH